jgi:hypothetical protein
MNHLDNINLDRQKRQIYAITEQDEEEGSEISEAEKRKNREFLEMKDGVKMQLLSMQEDQEEEK